MPDREQMRKSVQEQLQWDSRIRSDKIEVAISDHGVVLSGVVPSYWEKVAAETDAWSVPGVASVTNSLLVSDLPPGSDRSIQENATSALKLNEATENQDISVVVSGGNVELRGSVDEYWRKERAVELISHIRGVSHIDDSLAVVPADQPADEVIAADIISAIKRKGTFDLNNLEVRVSTGKVVLMGRVPDWQSYSDLHTIVKHTRGVAGLTNELVIVPE